MKLLKKQAVVKELTLYLRRTTPSIIFFTLVINHSQFLKPLSQCCQQRFLLFTFDLMKVSVIMAQ